MPTPVGGPGGSPGGGQTPGDSSRDGRTFTDREMQLIFERAGEADAAAGGERRYSLAEIQEIAVQAGLNPADVARAAATIHSHLESYPVLGGPMRFHASHVLETRLSDDGIADVAHTIREATGFHGELRVVPGGAEWRVRSANGLMVVDFASKGAGTRIDLMIARDDEAAITVIGTAVAGLVVGVAVGMATTYGVHTGALAGTVVGAGAAIASAWAGARLAWSRAARKWSGRTNTLMQTISDAAERSASKSAGDNG